jgi:hypothetical protein
MPSKIPINLFTYHELNPDERPDFFSLKAFLDFRRTLDGNSEGEF